MYCGNCGTRLDDGSAICPSCGTAAENRNNSENKFNTGEMPNISPGTYQYQNRTQQTPRSAYYPTTQYPAGEPVSVLRWIGRMLIPWIPFVGAIVNFIMLIIWACSDRFEATSKNWAIARIIIVLIKAVISIAIGIALYAAIYELFSDPTFMREIQPYINGLY